MRLFKRCLTAPLRIKTTRGFGVHSPFAFSFITEVMRQKYQYYAYPDEKMRRMALSRRSAVRRRPAPLKYQHTVFRVVNRFSPSVILQLGQSRGLETMAALDTSSDLTIAEYSVKSQPDDYNRSISQADDRIVRHATFENAVSAWSAKSGEIPFAMVCGIADDIKFRDVLKKALDDGGVVLFPNIDITPAARRLWKSLNTSLRTHGMTFSNDRFGVIVGLRHLPRQTYMLYL